MKMLIFGLVLIVVIALIYYLCAFAQNYYRFALFDLKKMDLNRLFQPVQKDVKSEPVVAVDQVCPEDIKLFDDVAKLFFEKQIRKQDLDDAQHIQAEFLNKMPTQTRTQIKQFDLGEWSVFWSYKQQSLEYYAGRYGIFYTHVDAKGVEYKQQHMFSA